MTTINDLFQEVANVLAGRPVILRWHPPMISNYLGMFHKNAGQAYIDINPGLKGEYPFRVLLHECAHARLHFGTTENSAAYQKAPGSKRLSAQELTVERDLDMEDEADRQAARWAKFAEANAWRFDGPEMVRKLLALKHINQISR